MLPRVLPANPNAVLDAVRRKKQSVMETTIITAGANTNYFLGYVLKVGRTPRYYSNPVEEDRLSFSTT
jgi:hypothetical protein